MLHAYVKESQSVCRKVLAGKYFMTPLSDSYQAKYNSCPISVNVCYANEKNSPLINISSLGVLAMLIKRIVRL